MKPECQIVHHPVYIMYKKTFYYNQMTIIDRLTDLYCKRLCLKYSKNKYIIAIIPYWHGQTGFILFTPCLSFFLKVFFTYILVNAKQAFIMESVYLKVQFKIIIYNTIKNA